MYTGGETNSLPVILIGAGVGLLIIVVIVVLVLRKRKAAAAAPAKPSPAPAASPVAKAATSTPVVVTAPVAAAAPGAPAVPQEQAPSVTYVFHQGLDSHGNDIHQRGDLANNVPGLKAACTALPNCKAFNTNGWIKHTIVPQAQWIKWTSEPNKGMYTRN